MFKRIMSGILLACIIVPTFFWAKDMVSGSVSPNSFGRWIYDTAYKFVATIFDAKAGADEADITLERDLIAADIQEIEMLLRSPSLSGSEDRKLRADLDRLMELREQLVAAQADELAELNKERIKAEYHFRNKRRMEEAKAERKSLLKIAQIKSSISAHLTRTEQSQAALRVNELVEAVDHLDLDALQSLSTTSLQDDISLARIRSMRLNFPSELRSGFELRPSSRPEQLEVWAGNKLGTLTATGGDWKFAEVWK